MGQKLVSIKFSAGSSPDLWSPDLKPDFRLEVSSDRTNWTEVASYYPNLVNVSGLPADPGPSEKLSARVMQSLIQNMQKAAFLVDDSITYWRIRFKDKFLTDDNWQDLDNGSFTEE